MGKTYSKFNCRLFQPLRSHPLRGVKVSFVPSFLLFFFFTEIALFYFSPVPSKQVFFAIDFKGFMFVPPPAKGFSQEFVK